MYVVDSSVFASIIVKDEFHHRAQAFLKSNRRRDLITVDQVFIETANTLWKHVYIFKRIPTDRYPILREAIIPLITSSVGKIYRSEDLLREAIDFAVNYGITVYDAVFIVLALSNKCMMASFDKKLYGTLRSRGFNIIYMP